MTIVAVKDTMLVEAPERYIVKCPADSKNFLVSRTELFPIRSGIALKPDTTIYWHIFKISY